MLCTIANANDLQAAATRRASRKPYAHGLQPTRFGNCRPITQSRPFACITTAMRQAW